MKKYDIICKDSKGDNECIYELHHNHDTIECYWSPKFTQWTKPGKKCGQLHSTGDEFIITLRKRKIKLDYGEAHELVMFLQFYGQFKYGTPYRYGVCEHSDEVVI